MNSGPCINYVTHLGPSIGGLYHQWWFISSMMPRSCLCIWGLTYSKLVPSVLLTAKCLLDPWLTFYRWLLYYLQIYKADFTCPNWFSSAARRLIIRILEPNPNSVCLLFSFFPFCLIISSFSCLTHSTVRKFIWKGLNLHKTCPNMARMSYLAIFGWKVPLCSTTGMIYLTR